MRAVRQVVLAGGVAAMILLVGGWSEAGAQRAGGTADVAGRYVLERFGGQPIPTRATQGAGQPCPGGGTMVSFRITRGHIELHPNGRAELRTTAELSCRMPDGTTRTQDMPQDMDGRYQARGGTEIRVQAGRTTLSFVRDAATGTLTQEQMGGVWRMGGAATGAAPTAATDGPEALLAEAIRIGMGERLAEPSGAQVTRSSAGAWRAGEIAVARDWENEQAAYVLVLQPDSLLEQASFDDNGDVIVSAEYVAPFASVGDTLKLVTKRGAETIHAQVLARARVRATMGCGMPISRSGWVYLMDLPADWLDEDFSVHTSVALPPGLSFAAQAQTEAPSAVKRGFQPAYLKEVERVFQQSSAGESREDRATLRQLMFGESGQGNLDWYDPIPLRGPQGMVYLLSVRFNNDLADKGMDTSYTYLLDGQGRVLERWDQVPSILAVGDVDGDGIDELLTELGPIHWNGRRWVIPQGELFYRGC